MLLFNVFEMLDTCLAELNFWPLDIPFSWLSLYYLWAALGVLIVFVNCKMKRQLQSKWSCFTPRSSLLPEVGLLLPPPHPSGFRAEGDKACSVLEDGFKIPLPQKIFLLATALLSFPVWRQRGKLSADGSWKIESKTAMPVVNFCSVLLNGNIKGWYVLQQNQTGSLCEADKFQINSHRFQQVTFS